MMTKLQACRILRSFSRLDAKQQLCRLNCPLKYTSNNFGCYNTLRESIKYTEKHEWVKVDGKIGTIGITNYAQEALGEIVFAQLPDPGSIFTAMEECGALESVKAASEVFCPIGGVVKEKNLKVEETPSIINSSPEDQGWLFSLEIAKPEELDDLLDKETYEAFLKSQQ